MNDIIFFFKGLVCTVLLVLAMQLEIQNRTIESHALIFIHTSPLVRPMNEAAIGAVKFTRDTWTELKIKWLGRKAKQEPAI
jgi:hypothetical protein